MNQNVQLGDKTIGFNINAANRDAMLKGLDLIGTTLEFEPQIDTYEKASKTFVPVKA